MRCSVVWNAFAHYRLAEIWLLCADRDAVTKASDRIDVELRNHPENYAIVSSQGWRIIAVPPLVATFEFNADDCKVTVLSIRFRP